MSLRVIHHITKLISLYLSLGGATGIKSFLDHFPALKSSCLIFCRLLGKTCKHLFLVFLLGRVNQTFVFFDKVLKKLDLIVSKVTASISFVR